MVKAEGLEGVAAKLLGTRQAASVLVDKRLERHEKRVVPCWAV